jgi:hypothetical protein
MASIQESVEDYITGSFMIYFSSKVFLVVKSSRIIWTGNVARMGDRTGACSFGWRNLREVDHLEDPGVDERIILR